MNGGYGPFPYISTPKDPPGARTPCYFCGEKNAVRWTGHVKPDECDVPICKPCDEQAKKAKPL